MTVPIISPVCCKNCRSSTALPSGLYECRFNPPTANAVMVPDGKGGINVLGVVSVFPQMRPDQKCGRFERGLALDDGLATRLAAAN